MPCAQGNLLQASFSQPLPLHAPVLTLVQAIHTPGAQDCNFTFHCIGAGTVADWTGTTQDHHDN